jgi:hypothetical protein
VSGLLLLLPKVFDDNQPGAGPTAAVDWVSESFASNTGEMPQ